MTLWTILLLTTALFVLTTATTGVNFIPQNEFYSTYSMWALSFSIDLNPYYDNINDINNTAMTLRLTIDDDIDKAIKNYRLLDNNNSTDIETVVNSLRLTKRKLLKQIEPCEVSTQLTVTRLYTTLDNIRDLYTHDSDRQKRSLLPWGGDILKSLFGLATKTDMTRLRSQLNQLSINNNEMIHVLQNSLTIVNKTNSVLNDNRAAINTLTTAIEQVDRKIRVLHNSELNRQFVQEVKISLLNRVNGMTVAIDKALAQISINIDRLSTNMEKALRNQISTTLVNPAKLRAILNGISRHLPSSLTLKSYDGNAIMWYYKHLPLNIIPDQNKIHIVSVIPLMPVESLFTLYRVIALPVPIEGTNQSSQVAIEGTHFAVSRNGNSYVIIDQDELDKCAHTDTTYCPLNKAAMNLARMPSCLSSLYLRDESNIIDNCPVKISDSHKFPIFQHLVEGKWIIATKHKIIIHPRCDNSVEGIDAINVNPPLQAVNLKSGYTGYTEYVKLSPYFYQTSLGSNALTPYEKINIGADFTPIFNVLSNYTFDYQLINKSPNLPSHLQNIEQIDKLNSLYEDLNRIGRNNNITYSNNKWHWFTTGLSIVFVLGLFVMAGIVMYRVHRQKGRGTINNVMSKFGNKLEYIDSGRVAPSEQDSQCIEMEPVLTASVVEERHGPQSQSQP